MKTTLLSFYIFSLVCLFTQAHATGYVVINLNDSGAGSLRAAITSANADASASSSSPHLISFDIFGGGTISLASNLPALDNDITVYGQAEQITISGGTGIRGFSINAGKTVLLHNLVVRNGKLSSQAGAGIANAGDLTLEYCTITSNNVSGSAQGGGISNSSSGTIDVTNCTIAGNVAGNNGGGFVNYGSLNIVNSTITGNSASDGGGIASYNDLVMINCTVTANNGGGIYYVPGSGTVALLNTISVGSVTGNDLYAASAATIISGYGLYGTVNAPITFNGAPNTTDATQSDVFGTNVLANNGGSTQTIAIIAGGPAVDNGTATSAPTLDQAGQSRSGATDIGAFEYQPVPTATFTRLSEDLVTVYSNPGNGVFDVEIGAGIQGSYDWKIVDMKGKVLQSTGSIEKGNESQMQQINLSGQAQGTYLLIITTGKGIVNKSLVKL
ncbi:MAG: C-terminal target protein [Chitinophagaceae bacterium]|nr:C-terminal target protein [Chitinophagaceae bacterium]